MICYYDGASPKKGVLKSMRMHAARLPQHRFDSKQVLRNIYTSPQGPAQRLRLLSNEYGDRLD
jgi:hypothetical protein